MREFGSRSLSRLKECHEDLQKIMKLAISRSNIDFGIAEGYRDPERQFELFKQGKSKIDGISKKSNHNYFPSRAVDIFIYHPDTATRKKIIYDTNHLSYVAGVVQCAALELYDKGEVSHIIRWGGNWDSDMVIAYDQSFDDLPHFELLKK